jgi:hypothetical protein
LGAAIDRQILLIVAPLLPVRGDSRETSAESDMTRRAIKCRMVPSVEQPESRAFKVQNLDAYVLTHRRELVSAALIIMRAFVIAPDRQKVLDALPRHNGFEQWSERVRAALVWLREVDPCESRGSIRDDDPITTTLSAAIGIIRTFVKYISAFLGPCIADGSERLSPMSRLLDEGEDVGDALVGIRGSNMVGIAPQNDEPRIGNQHLILPHRLDRLRFASVGRHHQSRGFDTLQDAISSQV